MMLRYTPTAGVDIVAAIREAKDRASVLNVDVELMFEGHSIVLDKSTTTLEAVIQWERKANLTECKPMTKREQIASMAMQGMLSNAVESWPTEWCAENAVKYADALLAELAKPKE